MIQFLIIRNARYVSKGSLYIIPIECFVSKAAISRVGMDIAISLQIVLDIVCML